MAVQTVSGTYDQSDAVRYHYGAFPPRQIDWSQLVQPLAAASAAVGRYDQMLARLHNSALLLRPLERQEAVVSSRMEGTISTLDEVLQYEAEQDDEDSFNSPARTEMLEVLLYQRAMDFARRRIADGYRIDSFLIRQVHRLLLSAGRGADLSPGELKTAQNYLADRIDRKVRFVPISPEQLAPALDSLFAYMHDPAIEIHVRTGVVHLEFEALHPFKDGNGRVGRMLIPLMLWHFGILRAPHFYVSEYFERNKAEYIERMRDVSRSGSWTAWLAFFLDGITWQANTNLAIVDEIFGLYDAMKSRIVMASGTRDAIGVLDFIFGNPVFRTSQLAAGAAMSQANAHRVVASLVDQGILRILSQGAGRRPSIYAFDDLLSIIRR